MKLAAKYLVITILIAGACSASQQIPGQGVGVSFQVFYDGLSPYGYWIDYPGYGIDNTTHTTYISGPKQEDVEKATGRSINTVTVKEHGEPSQTFGNNELKLYRPVISKEEAANTDIKPARITDKKEIQPVAERKTTEQEKKVRNIQPTGEFEERGKEQIVPKKEERQVPKAEPGRINPPPEPIEKRPLPEQKVNKPIVPSPVQKPLPKTNREKPVQPVPQQPKQNIPKRPRK